MVRMINEAFWESAGKRLALLFDGCCRVYGQEPGPLEPDGLFWGGGWQEVTDEPWPCHLAFLQKPPAAVSGDGCPVEARCRLFWPRDLPELPPGSRLLVEQQGQVFQLVCSGLPTAYPTHWEAEARLLPERA